MKGKAKAVGSTNLTDCVAMRRKTNGKGRTLGCCTDETQMNLRSFKLHRVCLDQYVKCRRLFLELIS